MKIQTYYDRYYIDEPTKFDPNSSLTDQDFKIQTDVDYLLSHMAGQSRTPLYGVQDTMTFEDWSNEMAMLKRRFLHLDEETRTRFGNAQNFLKWCSDPSNYEGELPTNLKILSDKKAFEDKQKYQDEKETRLATKIAKAIKGE